MQIRMQIPDTQQREHDARAEFDATVGLGNLRNSDAGCLHDGECAA